MKKSLAATVIEGVFWVAGLLVLWLAPEYLTLGRALIGLALAVSVISFLMSRRRLKDAEAAVAQKKRELEELRNKQG